MAIGSWRRTLARIPWVVWIGAAVACGVLVTVVFMGVSWYWETRPLPWDNPTAVQTTIPWKWDSQQIEIAPHLARVQSFQRRGYFVAKDTGLHVLDLSAPDATSLVATVSGYPLYNSGIAVSGDGTFFVANADTVYRCDKTGNPTVLTKLGDMEAQGYRDDLTEAKITGYMACTRDGNTLFFAISVEKPERASFLCNFNVATGKAKLLRARHVLDVDVDSGVAFWRDPRRNVVYAKDFDGRVNRAFDLSRFYWSAQLAPDKRTLLVSESSFGRHDSAIAVLDLESHKETMLSVHGSYAVWGPEGWIYFVCGETQLWRYSLEEKRAEGLFRVVGRKALRDGSYAGLPVLSHDKTMLVWSWAIKGSSQPGTLVFGHNVRLGTVLLDLERDQFRTLDQYWHQVQWVLE